METLITLLTIAAGCSVLGVTITYGLSVSGSGLSIQPQPITRTGSGSIGLEETLSAAEGGSLTTRTNDTSGTITMSDAGHTITTGATIDIFWSGGVQYDVTVGTVAGTSVPISGGSGDNLPTQDTAVTVVVVSSATVSVDGDNTKIIAIELSTTTKSLRTAGHIQLVDSGGAEVAEIDLVANVPQVWDIDGGSNNPFTGNPITAVKLAQANTTTTETYTLKIVGVQDATP